MKKACFRSKNGKFWRLENVLGFWAISKLLGRVLPVLGKNIVLTP
jgi:hypothetical protein